MLEKNYQTLTPCNFITAVTTHVSSELLDVLHQKLLFHHNSMQLMKLRRDNGVESGPFSSDQILIKKTNMQPYTEYQGNIQHSSQLLARVTC